MNYFRINSQFFKTKYVSIFFEAFILSFAINYKLNLKNGIVLALFVSSSIYIMYNVQFLIANFKHDKIISQVIQSPFLLFCLITIISYFNLLNELYDFNLIFLLFIGISILYVYPHKFNLRKIPYVKSLIISFSWTYILAILPFYFQHLKLDVYFTLYLFFFFLTNSLIFDFKDITEDNLRIKTLPMLLSQNQFKLLLLLIQLFLIIFYFLENLNLGNFIFFLLFIVIQVIFILRLHAKTDSKAYYFYSHISFIFISLEILS